MDINKFYDFVHFHHSAALYTLKCKEEQISIPHLQQISYFRLVQPLFFFPILYFSLE